ncbi:hypothetical protein [Vreelandella populi]|uniref:hypothetical protein n=1 Tax=Vreelandella populi TaxID=2498858 RepID=UPI000F8D02E7|nr:hypothetical protein [Halomonas populi]RUR51426.1 hypothetical protein ELY40_16640 [Halomonas populi]
MRRYQMLQGVRVPNSSLPSIEITAEGRAMGAIPFWNTMLDPNYVSGGKVRNRAVKATLQENTDGTPPTFGEFPNGERAFSQIVTPLNRSAAATDMNPNRWTVFVVQRGDASAPASREVLRTVAGVGAGEFSPRMGINASGDRASIYKSSSDAALRLGYTPESNYLNRTVLLMFTFSIERGLAIFENGELVASAPDDVQPLTAGYSAGEYAWHRQMAGLVGMAGLLDADLSAPENAGYRRAIERFLMTKYGIS